MAEFKYVVGGKFSTPGDDAKVRVVVDPLKPIPLGEHKFVLVAVDDAGNESLPSEVIVTVFDDKQPVAKLSDSPGKILCDDQTFLAYLRQVFNVPVLPEEA